jgi:hypothetical protein
MSDEVPSIVIPTAVVNWLAVQMMSLNVRKSLPLGAGRLGTLADQFGPLVRSRFVRRLEILGA